MLVFRVEGFEFSRGREGKIKNREKEKEVKEEARHRLRFDTVERPLNRRIADFSVNRLGLVVVRGVLRVQIHRSTRGTLIPRKWKARE